jgi:hypothetical protein
MPPARCGQHPRADDRNPRDSKIYDPSAVPEWARESIARIAGDDPGSLAHWLGHVAEIETAKQQAAEHPPVLPAPPEDPRDFLHLCAIEAWRALASGQPAPGLDPAALEQEICDAFGGHSPVDELCDDWLNAARERGITVDDEHCDILPGILETITTVITAAFWSGLTTGHFTITRRRYFIPRQFLPYFEAVAAGC